MTKRQLLIHAVVLLLIPLIGLILMLISCRSIPSLSGGYTEPTAMTDAKAEVARDDIELNKGRLKRKQKPIWIFK